MGEAPAPRLSQQATPSGSCPTDPDAVVSTPSGLRQALSDASAGDVVAIDGTISLPSSRVRIEGDGITLTCATPGSGIEAGPSFGDGRLLFPLGKGLTIRDLVLDAHPGGDDRPLVAIFAANLDSDPAARAEDLTLEDNLIRCGRNKCVTARGVAGLEVKENDLRGPAARFNVFTSRGTSAEPEPTLTFTGNDLACAQVLACLDLRQTPSTVRSNRFEAVDIIAFIHVRSPATIRNNQFDVGQGSTATAISAFSLDPSPPTSGVDVLDNDITCGTASCLFFHRIVDSRIARNHFSAVNPATGLHLQRDTDGNVIEENVIETENGSRVPFWGAIRVRDGTGVRVEDNEVRGPWTHSLAATNLEESTVRENQFRGSDGFAVLLAENPNQPSTDIGGDDNTFQANRIDNAAGGFLVDEACRNQFRGNQFSIGPTALAASFSQETGDNMFVANGEAVDDAGNRDCDGDGVVDPNRILGAKPSTGNSSASDLLPVASGADRSVELERIVRPLVPGDEGSHGPEELEIR